MIKGFLTNLGKYNEGELVGNWIEFPLSDEEFQVELEEIGIDGEEYEEYFFTDWDSDYPELVEGLGEYINIDDINDLVTMLKGIWDMNHMLAFKEESGYDLYGAMDRYEEYSSYWGDADDWDIVEEDICSLLGTDAWEALRFYIDIEAYVTDMGITDTEYGKIAIY